MKFLSLEDLTGTFEAVLFPDAYARCAEATLGTGPLIAEGRSRSTTASPPSP